MDASWYASPAWCHALTLTERSSLLNEGRYAPSPEPDDVERARRQLARWQQQPPFDDDEIFVQRLAADGLDTKRFQRILSASGNVLQQRHATPPPWMVEVGAAYSKQAATVVDLPPGEEILGFLELVQPLVDRACLRLSEAIEQLVDVSPSLPFDPETIEGVLLVNLADPLLLRLGRTLALELNVARLQGLLMGETSEERYERFLARLRQPQNALAILAEYPVLARQLTTCIEQWVDVSLEFIQRLCVDWEIIQTRFCPDEKPGLLVDLMGGAGDTHRQGHSVMIAEFESGFRIVYKPKSMAVDEHFQDLLDWVNRRGCRPSLRKLLILDRTEYGWVEYVQAEDCSSLDEVRHYYRRLGLYLALLYAINASDFHLENLIAAGDQPVLIDLETLFNPEFERFARTDAETAASRAMMNSVLVVAMLPQRLWSMEDYAGIDISGLGGEAGQLSPDRTPQPTAVGTDAMRYVRERLELPGESNRPSLDGVESNAADYVEDVVAGFVDMYQLLVEHRSDLLAAEGPLARFETDEVRVLLRPTRTYDQLLYESFHPDMLRDGLERDRLFDRLWVVVPERAYMARALAVEQAELQTGDIPVFTTQPTSLNLVSGCGEIIDGILIDTGMDLVRRRVQHLGDEDMHRQIGFIRSTLATLAPVGVDIDMPPLPTYQLAEETDAADCGRLLAIAHGVAERLAETALPGEEDVTWIGLEPIMDQSWDLGPLGMDLYGGIPGIGLFLAYAGACFEDERFTALARRVHRAITQYIELVREDVPAIGGFEGWGGLLYTLTHLAALWDDAAIFAQAEAMLDVFPRSVVEDDAYGIVRGSAGAIGSLLAYEKASTSEKALAVAVDCGDHLLSSATPMERGIGWVIPRFGSTALSGFGHGASGIAWALLRLAEASGEERFHTAALQALDYERGLFSAQASNWLDLRNADLVSDEGKPATPQFATAWCHGAPGIGMARLQNLTIMDGPRERQEIDAALRTTLASGFGQSHCLCHGDLGNLELLLLAEQTLHAKQLATERQRLTAMVVQSIEDGGWQCGGPCAVEMPTFMLGLSGIGYQLLRLADPWQIPSILTLEPPATQPAGSPKMERSPATAHPSVI
jgi:type 2 lantibiotic biosynthesis protein LanM